MHYTLSQLFRHTFSLCAGMAIFILSSCSKNELTGGGFTASDTTKYNGDWTFESHGNVIPNYTTVFPQDKVNTIELVMTAEQWTSIRANVKSIVGYDFGSNTPSPPTNSTAEPNYTDVTMRFNGKTWKNVGFRLKGNSTLRSAWSQGNYKLPFRLNFDRFEDQFPGITNQHFYGFEEMSFSPGFKDQSLIREKLASEVFRAAGIPAAQTAFYRVFIDFGAGLKYCGIYTGVEIPDDNMIKAQFGEEAGNIYKPESNLVTFTETLFEKKNNTLTPDFTDVKNFLAVLNAPSRISNPTAWRAELSTLFNVNHFLKYLAVNNVMVNWDSYGVMAHNYYLYNHSVSKLTWIPWDHNEAFSGSPGITGSATGGGGMIPGAGRNALSLTMNEVAASWPLIRYLADDPVFFELYKGYIRQFQTSALDLTQWNARIDQYQALISPYAIGPNGESPQYTYLTSSSAFVASFASIKSHLSARKTLAQSFAP